MPRAKKGAPARARGRQSALSQRALDLLESWFPAYTSTRGKSRASFWADFLSAWCKAYPSSKVALGNSQGSSSISSTSSTLDTPTPTAVSDTNNGETSPNDTGSKESTSDGATEAEKDGSSEEPVNADEERTKMTKMSVEGDESEVVVAAPEAAGELHAQNCDRKALERWFSNRSTRDKRSKNAFSSYVNAMSAKSSQPRHKPSYLLYQSNPEFTDKVNAEVERVLAESMVDGAVPALADDVGMKEASASGEGVLTGGDSTSAAGVTEIDKSLESEMDIAPATGVVENVDGDKSNGSGQMKGRVLNTRMSVAKWLFDAESEEVRARFEQEREERFAEQKKIYVDTLNGRNLKDPSLVPLRREQVITIAQPIADALSTMTQSKVVILCGSVDDVGVSEPGTNKLWIAEIESGESSGTHPRNFSLHDPVAFKDSYVKTFVNFLRDSRRIELGLPVQTIDNTALDGLIAFPPEIPSDSSSTITHHGTTSLDSSAQHINKRSTRSKGKKRARSKTPDDSSDSSEEEQWDKGPSDSERTPSPPPTQDYYPSTPELPRGVRSGLQKVLQGMEKQERRAKIAKLRGMGEYELNRENNIAENQLLLRSMGLEEAVGDLFTAGTTPQGGPDRDIHQKQARPRPQPKPLAPSTRTLRSKPIPTSIQAEEEVTEREREPEPQIDDERQLEETGEVGDQVNAQEGIPAAVELPKWLLKVQAQLLDDVEIPAWQDCWDSLVALEKVYDFFNPTKGLPPDLRPPAVAFWSSRGRNKFPNVLDGADAAEFSKSVITYWRSINPDWRRTSTGDLSSSGHGSWTQLRHPGQNGLLSIVACLRWWYELEEFDGGSPEWLSAVSDVTWALKAMEKFFKEQVEREEEEEEEGEELNEAEPVSKKIRTA